MKKLGLLLIVLMPVIAALGQTEKGNFVLSGAVGLNLDRSIERERWWVDRDVNELSSFPILPSVDYFVADNFALGLSGGIYINTETKTFKTSGVYMMPTFLAYFTSGAKVRPYFSGGFGYAWVKDGWETEYDAGHKYRGPAGSLGAGVSCFITKKISLDLGLQYTNMSLKSSRLNADLNPYKYKQKDLSMNIGISIFL